MKKLMTIVAMFVTVTSVAQFKMPYNKKGYDITREEYLSFHSLKIVDVLFDKVVAVNPSVGGVVTYRVAIDSTIKVKEGDYFYLRLDSKYKMNYTFEKNVEFHIKKEDVKAFEDFVLNYD